MRNGTTSGVHHKMTRSFIQNWLNQDFYTTSFGPRREKTCLRGFANNTGADQPVHPRSLISAIVIRFLESIISRLCYERNFNFLASLCSWAGWFETRFVGNPKDRLSRRGTFRYIFDINLISSSHRTASRSSKLRVSFVPYSSRMCIKMWN